MRLSTIRTRGGTAAVRHDGDELIEIPGAADVGTLLADPAWRDRAVRASGDRSPTAGADFAPLVPRPEKIICVGLNYREHILEMGRDLPEHPTLFAKFTSALIGAHDAIVLPAQSCQMDWEAELGVVLGTPVRNADVEEAAAGIAGFTVVNDVTARDWQYRTTQWLQGKTFEHATPVGPALVSVDEAGGTSGRLTCEVNGEMVQYADIGDLVFGPAELVAYVSQVVTLMPGDLIATGTPGGVGHARTPPRYLSDGDLVVTCIQGIGECRNACRSAS